MEGRPIQSRQMVDGSATQMYAHLVGGPCERRPETPHAGGIVRLRPHPHRRPPGRRCAPSMHYMTTERPVATVFDSDRHDWLDDASYAQALLGIVVA